jgi:hypothetical protein
MRIRSFATIASLALLAATSLYGQHVTADVPFEFQVGKAVLPAGHYEVNRGVNRGFANNSDALTIACTDCKTSAIFAFTRRIDNPKEAEETRLVFNRYGDRYFLSKIIFASLGGLNELKQSKTEREFARNTPKSEIGQVVLARR